MCPVIVNIEEEKKRKGQRMMMIILKDKFCNRTLMLSQSLCHKEHPRCPCNFFYWLLYRNGSVPVILSSVYEVHKQYLLQHQIVKFTPPQPLMCLHNLFYIMKQLPLHNHYKKAAYTVGTFAAVWGILWWGGTLVLTTENLPNNQFSVLILFAVCRPLKMYLQNISAVYLLFTKPSYFEVP